MWNTHNIDHTGYDVRIHLYEGNKLVYKITEAAPISRGSYDWIVHIPQIYSPDLHLNIEICWLKNIHICGRSAGHFRINHPSF